MKVIDYNWENVVCFFLATVIIVVLHDTSAVLRVDAEKEDPFPVVNLNGPSANTIGSIARADPVDEENGIRSCFVLFFFLFFFIYFFFKTSCPFLLFQS